MKRSILLAGILTLVLAGFALAQGMSGNQSGSSNMSSMQTVSGTVVSSNDNSIVITTDDGTRMTFTRDSMSGNLPSGIQNGSRVTVQYDSPNPGSYHVDTVTLAPAGTSNPSETSPSGTSNPSGTSIYGSNPSGTTTESNMNENTTTTTTTSKPGMPRTASPVPLIGLAGLLALGAGFGLRAIRQH